MRPPLPPERLSTRLIERIVSRYGGRHRGEAMGAVHMGDAAQVSTPVPVGADAPILAVMSSMQAMRRLRPDPVPDELLRRLVEAAMWAGTGGDLERQSFIVVTDREQMRRLADVWQAVERFYLAGFLRKPDRGTEEQFRRTLAA